MFERLWNSPTLMTWMSYSTKALTLFGVLPLVLKLFSPGDIVLWYLFSTIISLQTIADFGFRQTFSRIISYAFGGARDVGIVGSSAKELIDGPNYVLLEKIISVMKYLYLRLTFIVFVGIVIFGTWAMYKPIEDASNIPNSWWSWVIVVIISTINFYGKIYMNFLEGLNKIALVRRVEVVTSIGSIVSSIIVLIIAPTLLNLIIVNQSWILIVTIRDWYLCKTINDGLYEKVSKKVDFDRILFLKIWQPAWKSGLSGFMSIGLTNLTGVIYAQIGSTEAVASYLLALRIINQIREVSMAPFYSKIPTLAILRVKNDIETLVRIVKRGMFLSHLVFIIGFLIVGLFSHYLLLKIGSEVEFVSQGMWLLLGVAYFIHRFGAMHIQVYISTNHIISHIADGISGVIYLITSIVLARYVGIYAIPLGMICGYLGFYSWYAAGHSYKSMGVNFYKFERVTCLMGITFLIYGILIFMGYLT